MGLKLKKFNTLFGDCIYISEGKFYKNFYYEKIS